MHIVLFLINEHILKCRLLIIYLGLQMHKNCVYILMFEILNLYFKKTTGFYL